MTIADDRARQETILERFWETVMPEPNSGCWLWTGSMDGGGYGHFFIGDKTHRAHRFSYEAAKGPIPAGLQLDHLCRVRCCVNPDHLEAVTQRENIMRGVGVTAVNAVKTHCPKGHPLSGDNLRIAPTRGDRICRACERIFRRSRRLATSDLRILAGALCDAADDVGVRHFDVEDPPPEVVTMAVATQKLREALGRLQAAPAGSEST